MAQAWAMSLALALGILLSVNSVLAARVVGGDGVVFHFHGKKDADFCLISDPGLHINAHMIGRQHSPQPLTWISALGVMYGDTHLYINTFSEAIWDAFLDHFEIRLNGEELRIPAPGHKAGPTAEPGVWESPDHKIKITRRRVNEARIEIEGLLDLRLMANTVERDLWLEDNCFVHLDMEFRQLKVSPAVHGVLGQTYRPQRVKAARFRARHNVEDSGAVDLAVLGHKKGPAIVGRMTDYYSSGLWTADCKFSKFTVTTTAAMLADEFEPEVTVGNGISLKRKTAGARSAKALASSREEDVNPLEGYFSENAIKVIRRSRVFSDNDDTSPDAFADPSSEPVSTTEEGYVVEIAATEKGAAIDGSDADDVAIGGSLESLMGE